MASTPGGEEILESLIEKVSSFFEEGEVEGNLVPLPIDSIQEAPRTIEEGAFQETFPRDTHSITDPKNLGDHIMKLPADLFGGFLRSPKAKQEAYKAEHEEAVQELQTQYPSETSPELAQKITTWKQAVANWCGCSGSEAKESRYEEVKNLASEMPQELWRLVALSQAMKIMEDAITYSQYLPLALKKYNVDRDKQGTEEAKVAAARSKTILLGRLDNVNNNIKKLEEVADTIVRLSEQKNCCLVSAAAARAAAPERVRTYKFEKAAETAQQAIDCYLQYGQKMKEGDAPGARLLRLQGSYSECWSLMYESQVRQGDAAIEGDSIAKEKFSKVAFRACSALLAFDEAFKLYGKSGAVEVLQACEQVAQYCLQAAQAYANGNSLQAEIFSKAADSALIASLILKGLPRDGEFMGMKLAQCEQDAKYHLRRAEIYAQEGVEKGDAFTCEVYDQEINQRKAQNIINAPQGVSAEHTSSNTQDVIMPFVQEEDTASSRREGNDELSSKHQKDWKKFNDVYRPGRRGI
ncbi:MAG: hypothetical protein A3F67_02795 [Verrucomicrobia bacterium RIFCSPHIGHO2_12_FULL_41_10]|nr:MAG: hypothetical protein A3F67_02795 [Verrucomicrobia bacterium RIFCSPHIGHO2_12_FULL_41_10]